MSVTPHPFELLKPYLVKNRLMMLGGLACLVGVDILQLLIPRIIKWAVDDLTFLRMDARRLTGYAGYIVLAAALTGIFRYGWRRCLMGMARRIEEGLRNELYHHVLGFSAASFERFRTGEIMAHATNDIANVRMAAGMGIVALTDAVFLGGATVVFMLYIHPELTALALLPMPLIVVCTRVFSRIMHTRYREVQQAFSHMTEIVRERFAGIRVIKAYNMQPAAYAALHDGSERYVRDNLSLMKMTGLFFPMMIFFTHLSLVMVLYAGGRKTILTGITPGDFVAFIHYLALMTWPMMALGWVISLIQRGRASLERIHRMIREPAGIRQPQKPAAFPRSRQRQGLTGDIVFENVWFSYPDAAGRAENTALEEKRAALRDIHCRMPAGSVIGITGPPGSGKSTLLHLLPRLFDVDRGCITIAGEDIRHLHTRDLRAHMTVVPQEPFLFSGTIRENITFRRKASGPEDEERLMRALQAAALEETIRAFDDGVETVVGEKGIMLSGGQKQRVALARALMRDTPLLLLDDPISQVDTQTGAAIMTAVRAQARNRTLLIVSHRFSAFGFADSILVMRDGRIIETGSHRELMAADRYYARTFRLQQMQEEAFHAR